MSRQQIKEEICNRIDAGKYHIDTDIDAAHTDSSIRGQPNTWTANWQMQEMITADMIMAIGEQTKKIIPTARVQINAVVTAEIERRKLPRTKPLGGLSVRAINSLIYGHAITIATLANLHSTNTIKFFLERKIEIMDISHKNIYNPFLFIYYTISRANIDTLLGQLAKNTLDISKLRAAIPASNTLYHKCLDNCEFIYAAKKKTPDLRACTDAQLEVLYTWDLRDRHLDAAMVFGLIVLNCDEFIALV